MPTFSIPTIPHAQGGLPTGSAFQDLYSSAFNLQNQTTGTEGEIEAFITPEGRLAYRFKGMVSPPLIVPPEQEQPTTPDETDDHEVPDPHTPVTTPTAMPDPRDIPPPVLNQPGSNLGPPGPSGGAGGTGGTSGVGPNGGNPGMSGTPSVPGSLGGVGDPNSATGQAISAIGSIVGTALGLDAISSLANLVASTDNRSTTEPTGIVSALANALGITGPSTDSAQATMNNATMSIAEAQNANLAALGLAPSPANTGSAVGQSVPGVPGVNSQPPGNQAAANVAAIGQTGNANAAATAAAANASKSAANAAAQGVAQGNPNAAVGSSAPGVPGPNSQPPGNAAAAAAAGKSGPTGGPNAGGAGGSGGAGPAGGPNAGPGSAASSSPATSAQHGAPAGSPGSGGGGKIICAELYRQGLLQKDIFIADEKFGDKLPKIILDGYHLWARPIVAKMQKDYTYSKKISKIATPIAKTLASFMGVGKPSAIGLIALLLGVPVCAVLGLLVSSNNERIYYAR